MSFARFVGIPYEMAGRTVDGVDCWGLVRLVYIERYGIDLPSYAGQYADPPETEERAALVAGEARAFWSEVEWPMEGDVVLAWLTRPDLPVHIGVAVDPERWLHVRPGAAAIIERFDTQFWRPRIAGFYRHRSL